MALRARISNFKIRITAAPLAAMALFAALGCTKREVPRTEHEAPIPTETITHAPRGAPASQEKLDAVTTAELELHPRGDIPAGKATSTLRRLGEFILNGHYVEDPRISQTTKMRQILTAFNEALLQSIRTRPEDAETRQHVDAFVRTALSGCDSGLKGCVNIPFFRKDPGSASIFLELAKLTEKKIAGARAATEKHNAVRIYYRYIMVAFDLKNQNMSAELEFLYLNRASDYAAYFASLQTAKAAGIPSGKVAGDLQRHVEIFEMILNKFNPDLRDPKFKTRFKGFVDNFQPWSYSRREPGPFGVGGTKMLELAAKNFLYETSGALNPSLVKAIEDIKAKENSDEPSFKAILNTVRTKNAHLLKAFGLDVNLQDNAPHLSDEYFFIIDRLYSDHLNPDDATAIWAGSRKDANRFLLTLETYIKVQLAHQISRTNSYFREIYENNDETSANVLFRSAVDKRIKITTQWKGLAAKIDRIGIFFNRHMKGSKTAEGENNKEFLRINSLLGSLGRNIRLSAVYPNMMLMLALLEDIDTKLDFYGDSGYDEIKTGTGLNSFLNGEIKPFFAFSYDHDPNTSDQARATVRRLDTLYAFDAALKADSFDVFSAGKNKIDEVKFFTKFFDKYFADEVKEYREEANKLRDLDFRNFMAICQQDEQLLKKGLLPGSSGQSFTIDYFDIPKFTYMGSRDANSKGKIALDFYGASGGAIGEKLHKMERPFRVKMTFAESLLEIHKTHLESIGIQGEDLDKRVAAVKSTMGQLEGLRARYLSEALRRHMQISSCVTQMFEIEHDRQRRLLRKEEEYLGDVWERMKAARAGDASRLEKIESEYSPALPGDTALPALLGKPTADEYKYYARDLHLRLRRFMRDVAPNVVIHLPDFTAPQFANPGEAVILSGSLDKEAFIQQAFRAYKGQFLGWLTNTSEPGALAERVRLSLEFYRLGEFPIHDWGSNQCKSSDLTTCPIRMTQVGPEKALEDIESAAKLLSLTKAGRPTPDVALLARVGLTSRYTKDSIQALFLDDRSEPLPIADKTYQKLYQETADSAPDSAPEIMAAMEYFQTAIAPSYSLSTTVDAVNKVMRKHYRGLLRGYKRKADDFEAAVGRWELSHKGRPIEIGYEIEGSTVRTITPTVKSGGPKDGAPIYLGTVRTEDFKARMQNFSNSTRGHFDPKPGDSDCRPTVNPRPGEPACVPPKPTESQ